MNFAYRPSGNFDLAPPPTGPKLAWPTPAETTPNTQSVPEDFRNRMIHKCWKIVKS